MDHGSINGSSGPILTLMGPLQPSAFSMDSVGFSRIADHWAMDNPGCIHPLMINGSINKTPVAGAGAPWWVSHIANQQDYNDPHGWAGECPVATLATCGINVSPMPMVIVTNAHGDHWALVIVTNAPATPMAGSGLANPTWSSNISNMGMDRHWWLSPWALDGSGDSHQRLWWSLDQSWSWLTCHGLANLHECPHGPWIHVMDHDPSMDPVAPSGLGWGHWIHWWIHDPLPCCNLQPVAIMGVLYDNSNQHQTSSFHHLGVS